jgi:hypothetical protein
MLEDLLGDKGSPLVGPLSLGDQVILTPGEGIAEEALFLNPFLMMACHTARRSPCYFASGRYVGRRDYGTVRMNLR